MAGAGYERKSGQGRARKLKPQGIFSFSIGAV
jgi:hypothetical protein